MANGFGLALEDLGKRKDVDPDIQPKLAHILTGLTKKEYPETAEGSEEIPEQLFAILDWLKEHQRRYILNNALSCFFAGITLGLYTNNCRLNFWSRFTDVMVHFKYQDGRAIDPESCGAYMHAAKTIIFVQEDPGYEASFLAQIMRLPSTDCQIKRIVSNSIDGLRISKAIIPKSIRIMEIMSDRIADGFRYPHKHEAMMVLAHCYLRYQDDQGIPPAKLIELLASAQPSS